MTRDKANRQAFLQNKKLIDKIYDDVNSRKCENCKFGDGDTEGTMICRHPDDAMPFHVPLDFGCRPRFERIEL